MPDIEEIYKLHAQTIYQYVLFLTHKADIAEEIVQETFEVAIRDIHKFKGECKVSVWLCQIAKYIWYQRLRKQKRVQSVPLEDIPLIPSNQNLEEIFCMQSQVVELLKMMQNLDEETKTVMYLRLLGNFSYTQIAEIIGKTSNWARVTYFRGRKKIREELENEERM